MPHQTIKINMQHQLQDQWCWAAVSTSVSIYYNPDSNWTQCKVVNNFLEESVCCKSSEARSSACNKPWYLNRALDGLGNYKDKQKGALAIEIIATEIEEGRPLGCLVKWDDGEGSGHFVIISGVNVEENSLDILDPWNGPTSDLPYDVFATKYRGDGLWNYSFFTKK